MATNCIKSGDFLTLMKMPPHVKRFVIVKVNKTRRPGEDLVAVFGSLLLRVAVVICIIKILRVQIDVTTMFCHVF